MARSPDMASLAGSLGGRSTGYPETNDTDKKEEESEDEDHGVGGFFFCPTINAARISTADITGIIEGKHPDYLHQKIPITHLVRQILPSAMRSALSS